MEVPICCRMSARRRGWAVSRHLCWCLTCARAGLKCHGGSLAIPAQLSITCYCPMKCSQHTSTQCYYFCHWRNTEVNPLCWGMWCHTIVIYRKRQQLWLRVSQEWHATDCSCNAIPWPACNSSCRWRERFFLHSSWGSQSAEWSLHLAKCFCQL